MNKIKLSIYRLIGRLADIRRKVGLRCAGFNNILYMTIACQNGNYKDVFTMGSDNIIHIRSFFQVKIDDKIQ